MTEGIKNTLTAELSVYQLGLSDKDNNVSCIMCGEIPLKNWFTQLMKAAEILLDRGEAEEDRTGKKPVL